jgi:poly(3-hydroxybutyrate) depolymerase
MSGIFSYQDINKVFTKYLPLLQAEGYGVDESRLHLVGLSNGGSASNVALQSFSSRFQTISFISTSCNVIKSSQAKVILFGGGRDASAAGLPSVARQLQRCGTRTALMFDEHDNHYMMVHQSKEMLAFLNHEMGLSSEE